ncbi:membrane protein [Gallibacterium salpingitidis]|uniref:Membrane protein n=1 Tax=Gallibacterium salpingitidis TaxID=505341 RepID=A0AB36E1Q1_9PAST|nr:DUF2238 domain-containing protein [Gallibacterium salpingitidis]OBX08252.1 membrane protein [Gallibacterium salpingitidis]OBX08670.1 membrane protein [Gallibacterium salpingitidis]WKS99313.1 DUF2238 domain-containing protein [Gallibacterium salpingitidis]
MKSTPIFPKILAIFIAALMIWSFIQPYSREVWIAEMVPVILVFLLLIVAYPKFQFSTLAYVLMSGWLIMHTIGAHYTFERVPFTWGSELLSGWLGDGRNHFDRVAHYIIGFYSFPIAELLVRKRWANVITAGLFGLFSIMSIAAAYEIIEWQYAVQEGGDAGIAFLGSQGDIWDAQKDMLADTLGAITALMLFYWQRPDKKCA